MVTPNGDKNVFLTSNIIPFKYDISNPFTSYSNNNFILRSNYICIIFLIYFFNSCSRKIDHYYTSEYSNSFFSYDDQVRSKIFLELIASELTVAYATQGLIMSEPIKKTKIIPLSISLFLSYPFLFFFRHFTKISSFCIHLYISTTNLLSWWQGHCLFSIKKIDRSFRSGRIFLFFLSLQHQPIPPKYHHTIFYHIYHLFIEILLYNRHPWDEDNHFRKCRMIDYDYYNLEILSPMAHWAVFLSYSLYKILFF